MIQNDMYHKVLKYIALAIPMKEENPYVHRDISWLSFNYRVLQEAKDPMVPLFERIKFLAIYSSNLGEFFKVRIANHRNLMRTSRKTKKKIEFNPKEVLEEILRIINDQLEEYSTIFSEQIIPELKKNKINLLKRTELNLDQLMFVNDYFKSNLLPFVQPVLLVENKVRAFLSNGALYLALHLRDKMDPEKKLKYAIVKVPSEHLPRFIKLPQSDDGTYNVIMIDDIVRQSVSLIFPGFEIIDSFSIKLTRDAELYIDDEFSGDLIAKIRKSLAKRNVNAASRLVYDREIPQHFLNFLQRTFELDKYDLLPEGRYHNNFDFFKFPDFGMEHLKNDPLPPISYPKIEKAASVFEAIQERDHLIHVPYHSYESVIRFFEEAAADPQVTDIKIIQYRVGSESRIMKALMKAVKNKIKVSSFVEVKARFDEEENLKWGEKLEKAGVKVFYSIPGLKVHSKMALVIRMEEDKPKIYTYLATGNFHEGTAKVYSDIGLFTIDSKISSECLRLFSFLETKKLPTKPFKELAVGQFNLNDVLINLVQTEIKNAKAGKTAKIILKMNSLQETEMIDMLYEASQAGVQLKLIVRGICSLVAGVPGISDNIEVISIVDRFLEHARIFIFHNDGDVKIFGSSADWMYRNLHHRIETVFPIKDDSIKKQILEFIDLQLMDNVKARKIGKDITNIYRKGDKKKPIQLRSQIETYYYIKRITE